MVNFPSLPQLSGGLFLSDGGLETTLDFLDRVDLPHFAAFPLLDSPHTAKSSRAHADKRRQIRGGFIAGSLRDTTLHTLQNGKDSP